MSNITGAIKVWSLVSQPGTLSVRSADGSAHRPAGAGQVEFFMIPTVRWVAVALTLVCALSCKRQSDHPDGPPAYAGFLEAAHNTQIIGWAWDKNRPDEPVSVTILDGKKVLTSVQADVYRKDLRDGKIGTGKYGFVVPTPASLKDGQPHEIHAVVSGTDFELKNSPKRYQSKSAKKNK